MKSSRSTIVKDLLIKSGTIKMASLVELWTHWSTYVGTDVPRPLFGELHRSDLQIIDTKISKRAKYQRRLRTWSFDFKPSGLSDIGVLDMQLDEKRLKELPVLRKAFFVAVLALLCCISLAVLTPLVIVYWVGCYCWERQSYHGLPPHALPVLIRLRKRLSRNLRNWTEQDLQALTELMASQPSWDRHKETMKTNGTSAKTSRVVEASRNTQGNVRPSHTSDRSEQMEEKMSSEEGKPRRKINAKEVMADIRRGMDDRALMEKYCLSAKQVAVLYKKLKDSGLLNGKSVQSRSEKA